MTKVKICGITNLHDAAAASEFGADMLGFNFYEQSPRYIDPRTACSIAANTPPEILKVGVFVNAEPERIGEIVRRAGIDAVQLHGDEDEAFVVRLRNVTDAAIIKAFRVRPNADFPDVAATAADLVLLDSFAVGAYGGTGRVFDWSRTVELSDVRKKLVLAGGLNAENVAGAVRTVQPFAVDAASGIESSPGKKDIRKLEAFITNAKKKR